MRVMLRLLIVSGLIVVMVFLNDGGDGKAILAKWAANFSAWLTDQSAPLASGSKGAGAITRDRAVLTDAQGRFDLYNESHALLIGNITYQYWDKLPDIEREIQDTKEMLVQQGFEVHVAWNLNSELLQMTIKKFLNDYGSGVQNQQNRLVVFYSGHGETRAGFDRRQEGYIIPTDAPQLLDDENGFLNTALSMESLVSMSNRITTRHVLFLFDSCFSGSVLQTHKGPKSVPEVIKESVRNPVRQFLTAGAAGERVPGKSEFVPALIRGLQEGEADLTKDGYITGTELAIYVKDEVARYAEVHKEKFIHHPQEGKIGDGMHSEGDLVFAVKSDGIPYIPPLPHLTINASPETAKVRVLNITQPYKSGMVLKPGRYQIEVSAPDFKSKVEWLELSKQDLAYSVVLDALPRVEYGALQVRTNVSQANVYIDGIYKGNADNNGALFLKELVPGDHLIETRAEGYENSQSQIAVVPNQLKSADISLKKIIHCRNSEEMEWVQVTESKSLRGSGEGYTRSGARLIAKRDAVDGVDRNTCESLFHEKYGYTKNRNINWYISVGDANCEDFRSIGQGYDCDYDAELECRGEIYKSVVKQVCE